MNNIMDKFHSFAETNGDGKLDLIGIDAHGKPTVFQNQIDEKLSLANSSTEGGENRRRSARKFSFGIGGEMEIRSGLFSAKTDYQFAASAFRFGRKHRGGRSARRLGKRLCAGGI